MIITRTPLRISFVGGGSDLKAYYQKSHGAVVTTSINKYVYIFVNKRHDNYIRASYSKAELVKQVEQIEHNIIRTALQLTNISHGIDIAYMGDLQIGKEATGLSSSSSLAVGILHALYTYKGEPVSAEKLAQNACKIEIDMLKHPIGKQDQYILAFGGLNYMQFNSDESVLVDPIKMKSSVKKQLIDNFILLNLGFNRPHSSEILIRQKENTEKQKTKRRILDKMVSLAKQMRDAFIENDINSVGELLHWNWILKKKLADGISTSHIDKLYTLARKKGAIGGKICGAGGGGFLLLYAPKKYHEGIIKALQLQPIPFSFEPYGSKIIYNDII